MKKTDTISPTRFSKKSQRTGSISAGRRLFLRYGLLVVSVALMIAIGGWILNYLSKNPFDLTGPEELSTTERTETIEVPLTEKKEKKPVDPTKSDGTTYKEKDVEKKRADFTLAIRALEKKGAAEWGTDEYATLMKISRQADAAFQEKDFKSASEMYSAAAARAREMAGHMDDVLKDLITEGNDAIERGDGVKARQMFKWALMIDSSNQSALQGMERSEKIAAVMQLLASGQDYERSGKLTSAQADYQKAQQLDPENKDAPKAYQRVTDIIADQKFQQLVSEGLSAYHKKDFQRAKQRLLSAKYLRPGSKEVISALAQVDQGIRSARIESLRQKGVKAEKTENWEKALQAYQTVLKIDNNLQFAVQGEKRSLQQIEIDNQIAYFLENPGNLESDLQLENALLFIRQVDVMTPKGPNRTKALESLKRIVSAAQTPVKLIIESDNQTEVVLYRVGKLGRFDTREIQLRPGTYTVLGARDGYKDVRKQIVIKPGQGPLNVSVICKVEI